MHPCSHHPTKTEGVRKEAKNSGCVEIVTVKKVRSRYDYSYISSLEDLYGLISPVSLCLALVTFV